MLNLTERESRYMDAIAGKLKAEGVSLDDSWEDCERVLSRCGAKAFCVKLGRKVWQHHQDMVKISQAATRLFFGVVNFELVDTINGHSADKIREAVEWLRAYNRGERFKSGNLIHVVIAPDQVAEVREIAASLAPNK